MNDQDINDLLWLSKEEEMLRNRELFEGQNDEAWRDALRQAARDMLAKTNM
ncbi:MAG: hypothetical protein IJU65_09445 [Desulfovibrio sp.]|nr:hypothetical protein [Desulfovibrio sp.]